MQDEIKLPLREKIYNVLKLAETPMRMKEIYALLPNEKPHCIRGRIYNNLVGDFKYNKNTKNLFVRLKGSRYILAERVKLDSNGDYVLRGDK